MGDIASKKRFQICLNNCYKQNNILRATYRAASRIMNTMDRSGRETHLRTIRTCVPRSLLRKAQALKTSSEDFDEFLGILSQLLPSLQNDGHNIDLEFSEKECQCPIARLYPSLRFPPTWCSCSTEWAQLFESASGRPAKAELEKSVLKGDDVCKVRVILTE